MVYPDGFSLSHEGAKGGPLQTEDPKKVWLHNSDCWKVVRNNLFFLTLKGEYHFWYSQAPEFKNQLMLSPQLKGPEEEQSFHLKKHATETACSDSLCDQLPCSVGALTRVWEERSLQCAILILASGLPVLSPWV